MLLSAPLAALLFFDGIDTALARTRQFATGRVAFSAKSATITIWGQLSRPGVSFQLLFFVVLIARAPRISFFERRATRASLTGLIFPVPTVSNFVDWYSTTTSQDIMPGKVAIDELAESWSSRREVAASPFRFWRFGVAGWSSWIPAIAGMTSVGSLILKKTAKPFYL